MNDGFIATQIKRTNRNVLIAMLLLAAVGVIGLALSARYLVNVLNGPAAVDRATLVAVTNPDAIANYYVTVKGDRNIDSGYTQVTTTRSRGSSNGVSRTSAYFRILTLGDRALLVKASDNTVATTLTGALTAIPSDVQKDVVDDIIKDVPGMKGALLPFMLDAGDFKTGGYVIMVVLLVVFGLAIFALVSYAQRISNVDAHPIMKALSAFGSAPIVAAGIDAAIPAGTKGVALQAQNLILFLNLFDLRAVRMEDLAWAYRVNTRGRNAGPNVKPVVSVSLWDRAGKLYAAPFAYDEARATALLEQIYQRAPWVQMGFTPEIERSWKTNRAAFLQAVEARRIQAVGH